MPLCIRISLLNGKIIRLFYHVVGNNVLLQMITNLYIYMSNICVLIFMLDV